VLVTNLEEELMANNFGDDFEFKPLTDGLGFHKKIIDLKENPEKYESTLNQRPAQNQNQTPIQKVAQKLSQPLWNPSLKNQDIFEKRNPQVQKTQKIQKPTVVNSIPSDAGLEPVATGWSAAIFDSTMVLGLVLIFSAVIFAVTKIDFSQLMEMLQTEGTAQFGALVLLISVYEIYTVTCRTFFGKTVGESVFEFRLGTHSAQQKILYPIQVAWRSFAIALTGFIVLPILSTILNQDLAGILSGVSLYSEKK
jgi:hypothetical protein